jgi:hypothetical protein
MALVGQPQVNGNASVTVNGLGPTTHIVSFANAEVAVAGLTTIDGGATIAGIDMVSGHMAVQTTEANVALLGAAANGTVVATFTDNYPKA